MLPHAKSHGVEFTRLLQNFKSLFNVFLGNNVIINIVTKKKTIFKRGIIALQSFEIKLRHYKFDRIHLFFVRV